ncbi:MAG: hypothetical protein ACLFUZ_02525 [Candidatus Micrarchaeia archaeon]
MNKETKELERANVPAVVPQKNAPTEEFLGQMATIVKSNSTTEKKLVAVETFANRYLGGDNQHWAAQQLSRIAEEEFGSDFSTNPKELQNDKNRLGTAYSLAYGLSLFGKIGLGEAIKLVARMDDGRKQTEFNQEGRFSLSLSVALNTIRYLKDGGKLHNGNKSAAIKYLSTFLTKSYISFDTKAALVTLAKEIDPDSIGRLSQNTQIDNRTRGLLFKMQEEGMSNRLRGAVE